MRDDEDLGLGAWRVPAPPAAIVDRVMARIGEKGVAVATPVEVGFERRWRRVRAMLLTATVLAGVLAATVLVMVVRDVRGRGRRAQVMPAEAEPPPVTRREVARAPRKLESRAARDELLGAIEAARARREERDVGSGGGTPTSEEIRAAVLEVIPLLGECFTLAGEDAQRVGGRIVAKMKVISEPDVGALIEEVSLTDGDAHLLADAELTECVTQTLLSIELPPFDAGGSLVIHYPFVFAREEPEPGAAPPAFGDDAQAAARAGDYRRALDLAEAGLRTRPDDATLLSTAGIAACNLRLEAAAQAYIDRLSDPRAAMIRQICERNGVPVRRK